MDSLTQCKYSSWYTSLSPPPYPLQLAAHHALLSQLSKKQIASVLFLVQNENFLLNFCFSCLRRNWVFQQTYIFNPDILSIWWCKPFIFQTIILSNRIHSLKYLRSTTLCCKDIRIRKSEFGTKTQLKHFSKSQM